MSFKDKPPDFSIFPKGVPVSKSDDLVRIAALPRRKPLDLNSLEAEAMVAYEMRKYALPEGPCKCASIDPQIRMGNRSCIKKFLPIQAWALYEMATAGGLVGSIPVGAGKTLLSVMGALALGEEVTLLLVPPGLIEQLILDYQLIAQHFRVPGIIVTTSGNKEWRRLEHGMPKLYVLPYSLLQGKGNSNWIDNLNPRAIIADEVDALKDLGSARTKRLVRYFTGNENMTPEQRAIRSRTKFACWTGSITDQSIMEYAHLSAFALKANSPVPLDQEAAMEWARCLDAVPNPSPPGALISLCNPGENVRSAYRRRLSETAGFIVTGTSNVKVAGGETYVRNNIVEREAPKIPEIVEAALACVRNFERPDILAGSKHNEEIVEAMEQARYAQQIATGMFYRWIYPRGEPEPLRDRWMAARKAWRKEQRYKLFENVENMDSPGLLEDAAKRYHGDLPQEPGKPVWKSEAWPAWRDVRDLVQPKTQAVRLHPFLVEDAAHWGRSNLGIIWYNMVEFAQWLGELSGLPVHEGGPNAGANLRKERGDRSIIASIKSHGRGRNGLQYLFDKQLIAQTPASARIYEQCLDSKTEILTTDGWLGIDSDWSAATQVAAYNIEDRTIKWSSYNRLDRVAGNERMWGIQNPHLDIRVTEGHRMVVSAAKHVDRHKVEYTAPFFTTAGSMPTAGRVPLAGNQDAPGLPLNDHELTFIGLFMTDGNLSPAHKAISLFQSEKYPEVIKLIEDTLEGCGFNYGHSVNTRPSNYGQRSPLHRWTISYGSGRQTTYKGREVRGWSRLEPYLAKDYLPVLDNLNAHQVRVLLKAMNAGDGSKTQGTYAYDRYSPHTVNIATRRKSVADGIQSLCVRRGLRCNVSQSNNLYTLRISEDTWWSIKTSASDSRPVWAPTPHDPSERVWCVSVDTGAIVTRRNGKVAIVGNCLGRLHRQGQRGAVVTTEVYLHTPEISSSFEQALRRAEYVRETMGQDQKILDGWGDTDEND